MDHLHKLHDLFRRFPGIGPRQAKRFVYFLLLSPESYRTALAEEISRLSSRISSCSFCFRFYDSQDKKKICSICADKSRKVDTIMIVSKDADLDAIEKSKTYDGKYFVLGGTVPLFDTQTSSSIRSRELIDRIESGAKAGLREIIVACSLNAEGEHTRENVESLLSPLAEKYSLSMYTLGRGLSTGTELEYSDAETIKNALLSKKKDR